VALAKTFQRVHVELIICVHHAKYVPFSAGRMPNGYIIDPDPELALHFVTQAAN
jgi:hypothetical protein